MSTPQHNASCDHKHEVGEPPKPTICPGAPTAHVQCHTEGDEQHAGGGQCQHGAAKADAHKHDNQCQHDATAQKHKHGDCAGHQH